MYFVHNVSQLVVNGTSHPDDTGSSQNQNVAVAEKIYATLRECRDQAGLKKMRGIKHQGYLHRKSDKAAKKWKLLYFVLLVDGTDTHLYLYENPKRTKPKGLIDLSCAYLYQVITIKLLVINLYLICRRTYSRTCSYCDLLKISLFMFRYMIVCGRDRIVYRLSKEHFPVWPLLHIWQHSQAKIVLNG